MDGSTNGPHTRLMYLDASHHQNEEKCTSEWIESWKSTKTSKNENGTYEENMVEDLENKLDNKGKSEAKWAQSWKYFNHQYHSDSNGLAKSLECCVWSEAWKISKPVEYHDGPTETIDDTVDLEPLDLYHHDMIIPLCRKQRHKFWSSLFHEGHTAMGEWEKSWEVAKNPYILANVRPVKKEEPKEEIQISEEMEVKESEAHGLPKRLKPKDKFKNRQKLMNPLSEYVFYCEWHEAWKITKSKSKKEHWEKSNSSALPTGPMREGLIDWEESWKCSFQPSFDRPSSEWKDSNLVHYEYKFPLKGNSHLFAPLLDIEEVPPWCRTWKFINLLPRQYKPFWDRDHENFEVEVWPPMPEYVPPSYSVEEELSEWSLSWKICIPQRLEWDDIQTVFNCKDEVLWSRRQCSNYDYSLLSSEILSEKLWGRSWRFMKGHELSLLIAPKTDKTKWHLFSKIDKTNPFAPTWSKSAKLAKTQPREKAGSTSGAESKVEAGNISLKWVESWTVSNDLLNSQMGKVSWSDWVNSWRFLLASYSPEKKELSSQEVEMAERAEVQVYDNKQLRNQWENRANEFSKREELERSRVKKSALNGLFSEWNYRLAVRSGLPTSGEKKGKGSDMSDFRKFVVTAPVVQQDEKAMQAKFKVVAPVRRPAPPPPPPPVQKKREPRPPAPDRKERPKAEEKKATAPQLARTSSAPQPARAPGTSTAAYKDNLSQAGWNESWKVLKPLINMERALGAGRESFDFSVHKYRPVQHPLEEKSPSSSEWSKSYTTLKNEVHNNYPKEQKPWRSFQEPENLKHSEWGQSWKMQPFEFQQQVEAWGLEWSGYCRQPRDRSSGNAQHRGDIPQEWEESWKSFKPQPKQEGKHLESEEYWYKEFLDFYKHGVFCPGWGDSWKVPELQNHFKAFEEVYVKDWAESWRCSREHSWCKESAHLRHCLHALLMSKRLMCNKLKSCRLQEEMTPEWTESWKCLKNESQSAEEEFSAEERDVTNVPLHLQFHMLNTQFPGWDKSWCVSKAPSSGDKQQAKPQWRNSWKISNPNPSATSDTQQDIVYWSNVHWTSRYMESETDYITPSEWSESWQTMKPPAKSKTESQQELAEAQHHLLDHAHLLKLPLLDWNDSWKFTSKHSSSNTLSLSRWNESWRFSNPNHPNAPHENRTHRERSNGRQHINGPFKVDSQFTEWGESWKYLKSDSLKPDMPREDNGEWGECWRVLNPQLYLKKEAWNEQEFAGEFDDFHLQLSFLSKEDKKVFSPEFRMSEWNESWKFLKQEGEHKRK